MFDLAIKHGTIVTAAATFRADVGIRGERIAAVGEGLSGRRELDAAGKLVTPGAIDGHVHLEMPIGNFVSTDDFFTGTRAAAFGGTTAIVDFVETGPDETMLAALAARRAKAAARAVVDYGLHMTIGPTDIPKLGQLPEVFEAGCGSFKLYMAYGLRLTDGELLAAFRAIGGVGGLPVVHAENWDVICALVGQNLAAGRTEPRWHPRSRPETMEAEAAGRVIDIAALAGVPLHIFHVSCPQVVERIASARRRGLPVTAETCPQYLLLDDSVFERPGVEGALPVCAPPIRPAGNQTPLWAALARDDLQLVTTDHCPFTREDKATGLGDFSKIPGGVPAIEARFALLYSFGVRAGYFSANRWVELACAAPARRFGFARKGTIAPGFDADLVIFNPERRVTLSADTLHEAAGWTPYDGVEVTGWPDVTVSRGAVIVEGGEFVGAPGRGKFVARRFGPGRR